MVSGEVKVVIFLLFFTVCCKTENVQVNLNVEQKHLEEKSPTSSQSDIADTAKKKSPLGNHHALRSTQHHQAYHSRNYNENDPSKVSWNQIDSLHISKKKLFRSRRDTAKDSSQLPKPDKSPLVKPANIVLSKTTPSVISNSANTSAKSGKKSATANKQIQNGATTKVGGLVGNSTTVKPDCVNKTETAHLKIVHKFSPEDSMWAAISLALLLFLLFTIVWYSKMWRKNTDFYEKYGAALDTPDASTEMAWSKYGHTTTVSLKEIIQTKKRFFQELQMKVKDKFKNNNEQKSSGRKHTAKYSKLLTLPNDIDEEGSDEEDILYKRR